MATVVTKAGPVEVPDNDPRIRAHDALNAAAERIARGAYEAECRKRRKAGKRGPPDTFNPPAEALELTTLMPGVLDGTVDPEAAMALLHRGDILKARTS